MYGFMIYIYLLIYILFVNIYIVLIVSMFYDDTCVYIYMYAYILTHI